MGVIAGLPVRVRVDMRRAGRVGIHVLVRVDVDVGGSSDDVRACVYVLVLDPFRASTHSNGYVGVDAKVTQVDSQQAQAMLKSMLKPMVRMDPAPEDRAPRQTADGISASAT